MEEVRALTEQLGNGNIAVPAFVEACIRLTNAVVGCSCTGIWLFMDTSDGRVLCCLGLYDSIADRTKLAPDHRSEVQPYFDALEHYGFVSANDAATHPATAGLFATKLGKPEIYSLLAASFSVNGHLYGTLICTQIGETKKWTGRQLAMLRQISAPVGLALFRASRYTPTTGHGSLLD